MRSLFVIGLAALVAGATASSRQDFLSKSLNSCIAAESWSSCLKQEVLGYLDDKLGTSTEARASDTVDEALVARTVKYLKSFDYGIDIPFVDACLKYRPSRSLADLDVEFKDNDVATSQARGILKKKLLLPFLLLLKLKLKALMPIFVAIIGLKALKALVLSKLAIILVVGFIAMQFFKKGGMAAPMGMYLMFGVCFLCENIFNWAYKWKVSLKSVTFIFKWRVTSFINCVNLIFVFKFWIKMWNLNFVLEFKI